MSVPRNCHHYAGHRVAVGGDHLRQNEQRVASWQGIRWPQSRWESLYIGLPLQQVPVKKPVVAHVVPSSTDLSPMVVTRDVDVAPLLQQVEPLFPGVEGADEIESLRKSNRPQNHRQYR